MESSGDADTITRASRTNFALSFRILPKPKRDAIRTIYAFCRVTDDIVDGEGSDAEKYGMLERWTRELERGLRGESGVSLLNELGRVAQRFHIRETYFFDLVRGMYMDLERKRYRTFEELKEYCYRVASSVGLMCGEIFGYRNPRSRLYAEDLGVALQLTNIMRDVRADAARGRIYIPQEDFERFGYTEEQLLRGTYNEAFARLMHFEGERAKAYFTRARESLPREDHRSFTAARIMAGVYYRILRTMERRAYDVFTYRVNVSPFTAFIIAIRECFRRPGFGTMAAP